ncbi:hypothetical protein CDL15_Pgr026533 [Punica granatum]|uniref:Uncharacterized protein n=1 Tax=Punica granatum TaxID=22663 RepID=A0A218WKT0_PUNGR|nr:hypothetical protein CDL15_Pgr026533 [Punica granatum]
MGMVHSRDGQVGLQSRQCIMQTATTAIAYRSFSSCQAFYIESNGKLDLKAVEVLHSIEVHGYREKELVTMKGGKRLRVSCRSGPAGMASDLATVTTAM